MANNWEGAVNTDTESERFTEVTTEIARLARVSPETVISVLLAWQIITRGGVRTDEED